MGTAAAEFTPGSRPSGAAPDPARELRNIVIDVLGADGAAEALDALRGAAYFRRASALLWFGPDGDFRGVTPRDLEPPAPWPARIQPGEVRRLENGDGPEALAFGLPDGAGTLVACGVDTGLEAAAGAGMGELVRVFARVAKRELDAAAVAAELDTLRRRTEESEALHTLGLAAHRSLDPDEVLALIARFSRTLLGAGYVTVHIVEGERLPIAASAGMRSTPEAGTTDPFAARVVAERRPLTGAEARECFDGEDCFHAAEGMRTALGVPLSLFGETFGALVVGYRRVCAISPRDTRLALTLAGHAAVALSNARLHRTIAARSAELEQAYADLRRTIQEKERFFASMNHELRTPLNAIIGYQSLLLDEVRAPLLEGHRYYLQNAHRAAHTLLALVNDVLDLSKIEAGKIEVYLTRVELTPAIEEVLATIRPLADAKQIGIALEVEQSARTLAITDPARLRQILLNLVANAVKFTDQGEVRVAVAERDGEGIEIRVSDTGPGIPPEHHERIFEEFEQVGDSGNRTGTGLGLAIARKLARRLGGDLSLESRVGAGSTFMLRLPSPGAAAGGAAPADGPTEQPES